MLIRPLVHKDNYIYKTDFHTFIATFRENDGTEDISSKVCRSLADARKWIDKKTKLKNSD